MKKILITVLAALAVACAKDNDDDTTNIVAPPPAAPDQPANNPAVVGELLGTWNKGCSTVSDAGGNSLNSIVIDATTASMVSRVFQNSSTCSGTPDLESRATLAYQIPDYKSGQINQINMTVNSITAKFNSMNGVTLANTSNFCGFSDWQVGAEKDVTGRSCIAQLPGRGEPFYDIFKLSGNELLVGEVDQAHDGRSPEKRPVSLERAPYMR